MSATTTNPILIQSIRHQIALSVVGQLTSLTRKGPMIQEHVTDKTYVTGTLSTPIDYL